MSYSGMTGKLLRVNLTTEESKIEAIDSKLWELFIGGRGLGAYYLTKEVPPNVGPLSPDSKLIFMNGPLAGTLIPGNNKICVTFKSPLTNTYSYSLCGGHWGPELKFAGYDGLIIEGKAEKPVYISINNNDVKIRSAEKIWGNLIPESDELLREEIGEGDRVQIALIGPAGEKLVNYACITAGQYREFGRGGAGAVMGSKNLKGIAITGSTDVNVAKPEEIIELSKDLISDLRESRGGKVRRQYGTMELVERINNAGFWVTRNFTEGYFEEGYKLEGKQMREEIIIGDSSCFGCPIGCGKRTYVKTKDNEEYVMEGPEFETVGMLGSNCEISSWETLLKASKICDTYGFDTINAGACVSMVMEGFETGRLTLDDTDGIKMLFGNDNALLQILEKIGKREGIGDILAKGPAEAEKILKIEGLAIHSKGQSFPVYDPRGAKGMALTYATSPKGAHHMLATTFGAELSSGTRFQVEGKGNLERDHQFSMAIVDSIALCSTMRAGIPLDNLLKAYTTVTGIEHDIASFLKAAERIINLERMYNVNLGLDRSHDTLPKRFLEETLPSGESREQIVELDALLDDYYNVMGWDSIGIPTEDKLLELKLKDFLK
ncbi:MAG: aldehyde ferredoxin oxidoreductase family protein [Candidatus Lokiarchaeota archaeon]|nr:aldehyde ferredoxin oxidoreductase family protein [Candidatus Lokiarchaeota archaeon]